MSKHIEKETRVLISHEEYMAICSDVLRTDPHAHFHNYTNYYFDSPDYKLTDINNMVRIRVIDGLKYELTYKAKGEDGDLEINEDISKYHASVAIRKGKLPHGEIYDKVASMGVAPAKMKNITSLYTKRLEIVHANYTLTVDLNRYEGQEDYNIEVESEVSMDHALQTIKKYCEQYSLTYNDDYEVKSARAIAIARTKP